MDNPLYLPDLVPRDFFLFPKAKCTLKRTRFDSVKAKAEEVVKGLMDMDL